MMGYFKESKKLRLSVTVMLLLLIMVLGSSGATWVQETEAAIALPSWCPSVPTVPTIPTVPTVPTFPDVPDTYWAYEYIETLAYYGYVAGYVDGNYHPTDSVNRAQMAVFIERAAQGTSYTPTIPTVPPFPDVGLSDWFVGWVSAAKADGYVAGLVDGNYHPLDAVNRAQAAVFVTGLHQGTSFVPTVPTVDPYPDVSTGFWASSWINQVTVDELMAGFVDGNFHPLDPLNRSQIAVVLTNALCLPGFP
jgi:hypothetical protein